MTHLGYYETEEEAARVYDRVAIALNGPGTQTNFPASQYSSIGLAEFRGLGREDLQRALGVKPMDKSSQFRGVSRKKGKWEAKVTFLPLADLLTLGEVTSNNTAVFVCLLA